MKGIDMKKNLFKTKFNTAVIVLIPVCIGINFLGKFIAAQLKLPLWLDCIGTCVGGVLGGPVIGAICGAVNNLVYTITTGDVQSWPYFLTSIGIGLTVGIMARLGNMEKFGKALATAFVVVVVAVAISTPINVILWGGTTGVVFGDAVFTFLREKGVGLWLASLCDEALIDLIDKFLTIVITFFIVKALPKTITSVYSVGDEIKNL